MSEAANLLACALAAVFAAAALLNMIAPPFVRRAYQRLGYARSFLYLVGIVQGVTALFLVVPQIRIWGGILGAMLLFFITVGLLNRGKYAYAVPAMLLMVALAPAMA
jgi:hypothetical protein